MGTTVIILSAADCDSICTTWVLTSLLVTEMIAYQIHPVLSYEHIADYNEHILAERIRDEELHTVVMINCGATVDLHSMLFRRPLELEYHREHADEEDDDSDLDDEDKVAFNAKMEAFIETKLNEMDDRIKIYVLDSHRPFNLYNVRDQDKIYLLQGADEQKLDEFPNLFDNENDDGMTSDDDDDDDDDMNMDDLSDLDDDDLKELDDFEDNKFNEPPTKRRKISATKPLKKQ